MTIMSIAMTIMTIVIITIKPKIMMIITLVAAQVHCPQSQAQELQTKVESSLLRGKQETKVNT